ncbi:glutamate receptor 3.2 isoform X1 [Cryptomeria japonica]|uniref:glutamate receptor 3.2 isoform X1 n=3 Tax=Cryptomeria japonica TaxID=3369 RepID=UPI0027DAA0B8|nr:glutamate receptor 3.2 isoform X1 [Cryptomeria japonica]
MFPACRNCDVWRNAMRSLILFLLLFVELYDARPPEVRIGGVFDLQTYQGKQSNVAIQLAIQDVNNNPNILNGTILQFETTKIGSSALIDAENVLKMFRENVVSVVAPMTPQVCNFVSLLAESAQVLLITFAGSDPSMSIKHSAYSIQMIGRDAVQMKAVASLLSKFYWREVVVVFQDDELGLSGLLALHNALTGSAASIVQKFSFTVKSFNNSSWKEIQKRLEDDKTRSRVFILHTSYELAQKIFFETKGSGIMKRQGWAWIVTEWVAGSLDTADDTTMDSMQGVIGVRTNITDTPRFENISRRWKGKFMRLYPNVTHSENIGAVGTYAYDSVWVIAKAIEDLFRDNKLTELEFKSSGRSSTDAYVFQEGSALFQKAVNSSFEGISGNITFSKSGLLEIHSYDIVNVVHREIKVVGSWMKEELKLKEGVEIMWPDGSATPPSGFRKFIVGVPPNVVFPGFINIKNNNTKFEGFCIDVFKRAVEKLHCRFDYEFRVSEKTDKYPDYDDLVDQVANKTFDAVVADITILSDRSEKVDFTQPYTDTGLVIMVPIKNTKSSAWAFMKPFTLSMWLTALAFILLTAFLILLFERHENDAFTGETARQLEISLWFSFATIVFVQGEKIMTSLGKVILMVWLFVVLILNSSYTASLASYVTVQQLSPTIRDTQSLRASNTSIGHMDGSFVEKYLIDELRIDKNRLRAFTKATDYVESLRNGSIGAVVDETPYINMLVSENCGEFEIVSRPFYRGGFGFVFAKGSPVVPEMTSAVLNITQDKTELDSIRSGYFGSESCNDSGNDIGRLSPKNFWGLFVISTAIYCALLSAYLVSRFHKGGLKTVKVQPIPQENSVPAIQLVALDPNLLHSQSLNGINTASSSRGVRRAYTALPPLNVHHQQRTTRLHSLIL